MENSKKSNLKLRRNLADLGLLSDSDLLRILFHGWSMA